MRLTSLVLLALLPLAACSHAGSSGAHDSTPPPVADAAHECKPETLEAFTGKTADEATVKQLVSASGARNSSGQVSTCAERLSATGEGATAPVQ